jgi:glycosyltransferase involved in cell wall biosynthesis
VPIYVVAPRTGLLKDTYERSLRVAIASDARLPERISDAIRLAGDVLSTDGLADAFAGKVPAGSDGVIICLEGEKLLHGETMDVRRSLLFTPGRVSHVAAHLPGIPGADFVSLQPRAFAAAATREHLNQSWRLQGSASVSAEARTALEQIGEPWARLHLALLEERREPGAGIESLKKLSRTPGLKPVLAALILRNLIVSLLSKRDFAKAEELLQLGMTAYPDYAEFPYLTGVMWVQRNKPSNALRPIEEAMRRRSIGFVGSGGENSYRASWLLAIVHEFAGNQDRVVRYCAPGLITKPAFRPSVELFLKQQLTQDIASSFRIPLCHIARHESEYFEPVFSFLLAHRLFEMARVLLETPPLAEDVRVRLHERLRIAQAPFVPRTEANRGKPGVMLKGPLFAHSGHARINREIGRALITCSDLDAGLEIHGFNSVQPLLLPQGERLQKAVERQPRQLDLTIRHQWPPDFRRPSAGKLACILPWEHRAVPRSWVEQIERNIDELWVPSNFVRSAFVRGGVDATRVHVIPNGVNTNIFCAKGKRWKPDGCREFVFLFVGGAISRKGIDLLLQAYGDAFSPDHDVTLVIKDVGSSSFYQHNAQLSQIANFASHASSPHLVMLSKNLDDEQLSSLYRGCDAFVLPYRGEGFGMPIAEAMACGKPVIVTGEGPAPEFCAPDCGYLIPARELAVSDPAPSLGELTGEWTWFEPDVAILARTMRRVYENREEAIERGQNAAAAARRTLAWDRVLPTYLQRVAQLTRNESAQVFAGGHLSQDREEESCRKSLCP